MSERREKIEAMLKDDPNDIYLRYCLALEMRSDEQHDDSIDLLTKLSQEDPPHVQSFFMAAQQLAGLDRTEEARKFLRDGIEAAEHQSVGSAVGEMQHAISEMRELLMSLGSSN